MPAQDPTLDHTGVPPDSKLFGIPRYQPFIGGKSFDYEQKYSPDPQGKEASPEARVWATYLDEAEMYDHDMIQGFRDTIDSLLVLAGLFSAIVATFVAQTSQSLRPDFAQLNLLVQIEQTALLRTGGNVTAMNNIPPSNITTGTSTYTTADLWINGLFFTSLSLAIATALLAVLVKQWCQAYTSVTSGSAKDKVLTRQFRFDGLMKWKLPEIVGSLPLLLHLAFAVFFAGLSYFVYDLHKSLSSIVIFQRCPGRISVLWKYSPPCHLVRVSLSHTTPLSACTFIHLRSCKVIQSYWISRVFLSFLSCTVICLLGNLGLRMFLFL
ncbi:hypothetical protein DL96DRAFT_396831 [Flagelloscypha sp. PMI_526]|nr:hypothetical protein DL96DRAFT_396831 [Flagelloscypha sp. PMI_526]